MVPKELKVNGVKIDGVEAVGTSQPVHIDIHIHQESSLPELLKAGKSLFKFSIKSANTPGSSTNNSRLQLVVWTSQIILGAMSGALGIFFYMGPYFELWFSGAAFWTGAVAISSGVVAIIQEKRRGAWWSFLKGLFILATISTSIAAIVICAGDLQGSFYYFWRSCEESDWNIETFNTPNPQKVWKRQCINYMNMLANLAEGIKIMALLVWITLLMVTLTPIAFTLLHSYCHCRSNLTPEEDVDEKKPLHGELSFAPPAKMAGSGEA
ncbi:transmembrane protein 176A [Dromiciops gliroides]|uniref:transmembrane protein 176A n=1 Tax=Dromiciops gliroides TaxID=33562 RepID=UPI001CC5FD71|nr:transmembrane protein 176A [Dromiciops gliroides]